MKRIHDITKVIYIDRCRWPSLIGALGAVSLCTGTFIIWRSIWTTGTSIKSLSAVEWILAAVPAGLGAFCLVFSLGLLRQARVFIIDRADRTLRLLDRPMWGRTRQGCWPIDLLRIKYSEVPDPGVQPVGEEQSKFIWILPRDEEPILFRRTYPEGLPGGEGSRATAERLANDLGCPLVGDL